MTLEEELRRKELEIVARGDLKFAVLAWERQTARLLENRQHEIDALRTELRRVQALLEAAEIRLGERPRRKVARLKVVAARVAAAGGTA